MADDTDEDTGDDTGNDAASDEVTLFEAAGGMPFFASLVDAFYEGIVTDAVLLPLYPIDDLDGSRHRLTLFLAQYWGGPLTYMEERGHPKLRMRHMLFRIGPTERDHWLQHMATAVERVTLPGPIRDALMGYFVPAAEQLRNDTGLPISSHAQR